MVSVGAIRWDAWYNAGSSSGVAQAEIGPSAFQFRAPWFCTPHPDDDLIDCAGCRQKVVDLEIGYAAASGLDFWAFYQYLPTSTLYTAWKFYQQSSLNSQIKWCWIADPGTFYQFTTAEYVAWFQQTNYKKVLTNRPLMFFFVTAPDDLPTLATAITALRTAATGAGLGSPYIVAMRGSAALGASTRTAIGADAIGSYHGAIPVGQPSAYATADAETQTLWGEMVATGAPVVPTAMTGWDVRQRNPGQDWVSPGTIAERAAHISSGIGFVDANQSACPADVLLVYSWTECSEGGGALIPTVGDPPIGPPPSMNGFLSELANVIASA